MCKKQNCTIAASDLSFTDNGKRTAVDSENTGAATTVCKWGGGHSKRKRDKKDSNLNKRCKYGSECTRPDC